jgi:amino acid adenylation domain-containing protein
VTSRPLSYPEAQIYYLHHLEGSSPSYNNPVLLDVGGPLDVGRLERALQAVMARHEPLRTHYDASGATVNADAPIAIEVEEHRTRDLRALDRRAVELIREPFDLQQAPLMRVHVLRLARERAFLVMSLHHLISDGAALALLLEELSGTYHALGRGEPPQRAEPAFRYSDFARAQREGAGHARLARGVEYFAAMLAGAPGVCSIPADFRRPPVRGGRGAREPVLFPSIARLSERAGCTPFVTALSALSLLVAEETGLHDFCIGVPAAGRLAPETQTLIGCFVNPMAIRVGVDESSTFLAHAARLQQTVHAALGHQEAPFSRVIGALAPQRQPGHSPLFDVVLTMNNAPVSARSLADLSISPRPLHNESARFDWILSLATTGSGLSGYLAYDADLFDRRRMHDAVARLGGIIDAALVSPDAPLGRLLEGAPHPKRWSLVRGVRPAPSRFQSLSERFVDQASRSPEAIAVRDGARAVAYRALDAAVNRLARRLEAGRIAIAIAPSIELITGALAALAAGGAFVPIDPDDPPDRQRAMARASGATAVLVAGTGVDIFDGYSVIDITRALDETDAPERDAPRPLAAPRPDDEACVLFTSGTTGRPKGIAIAHRSVLNYLEWLHRVVLAGKPACVPAFGKAVFDAALRQWLLPCLRGDTVELVSAARRDPEVLLAFLEDRTGVTVSTVPTYWKSALARLEAAARTDRRHGLVRLILGGEPLSDHLVQRTLRLFPGLEIWNSYGPTETTIAATADRIPNDGTIAIGCPIDGVAVRILDDNGAVVRQGIVGEVAISGAGVAIGYIDGSDNHGAFTDAPALDSREYRTGDRGRLRRDGRFELLGRVDRQIKRNGHRIELEEIGAAAEQCQGIDAAYAHTFGDEHQRLALYYVAALAEANMQVLLRSHLSAVLPSWMVPTDFVQLAALPLGAGGKVDPAGLRDPRHSETDHPADELEGRIAALAAEVLDANQVPVDRTLFELGASSLMALELVRRTEAQIGARIPLARFLVHPTIRHLAREARAAGPTGAEAIARVARDGPLPVSVGEERLIRAELALGELAFSNVVSALSLDVVPERDALVRCLSELAAKHEAFRTRFVDRTGAIVRIVERSSTIELSCADASSGGLLEHLRGELMRPFDLTAVPLARALLLRLDDARSVLLVTLHHAICDGASLDILAADILSLLHRHGIPERGLADTPDTLAGPHLRELEAADYAAWERDWLGRPGGAEELALWRTRLAPYAGQALSLPTDRPRNSERTYRGEHTDLELRPDTARRVSALARRHSVTPFMVFASAFAIVLARHTGRDRIRISTHAANRLHRPLERAVGFFSNTLILPFDLTNDPTLAVTLERIRDGCVFAYAHQQYPSSLLVESFAREGVPEEEWSEVMLNYLEPPRVPGRLRGFATLRNLIYTPTPFDLVLNLERAPDSVSAAIEHAADLYDATTALRLVAHVEDAVELLTEAPERRLSEVRFPPLVIDVR